MMFCLVVFTVYVLLCDCGSLYYSRHEPPANTDAGEMPHPAGSILRSNCTSPKMEGGLGLPSSNDKNQNIPPVAKNFKMYKNVQKLLTKILKC